LSEFVLDCSVALSWCFPDEADPYALAVSEAMAESSAHTPAIWLLEVANGLLVAERRGRISQEDVGRFAARFAWLAVIVDSVHRAGYVDDVIAVGRQYGLSAYDAAYLELAIRLRLPIATLDSRLASAAQKAGVQVFKP
jgi:predicted nucleic acid-binding protein